MPEQAISPGSWVLVTGANGFVAAHVVNQILSQGLSVRGTVRDPERTSWLTDLFAEEHRAGRFELFHVPDMGVRGAFDAAVEGMSAVIHVATVSSRSTDPKIVIDPIVTSLEAAFDAAMKEPKVKRFVYTTSIITSITPAPGMKTSLDENSWNEGMNALAFAPPPYEPTRWLWVYAEGKIQSEKALWRLVKEKKPNFVVNTVSPATILGPRLHEAQSGSIADMVKVVLGGDPSPATVLPAMIYSNVIDVAKLHVGVLLDPDVANTRLYAWANDNGYTWQDVVEILRKLYPTQEIDDITPFEKVEIKTEEQLAVKLLKKWGRQDGWTPFDVGVKQCLAVWERERTL